MLRITPKGGTSFKMWINTKTHLIARYILPTRLGLEHITTLLSDYRTVDGVKIAFHRQSFKGDTHRQLTVQLKSVSVNVPVNAADFKMPEQRNKDFSIIDGGHKVTIPFTLIDNKIYFNARINGHLLRFELDSGGTNNVLTPQAARAVGIEGKGALSSGGAGPKSVKVAIAKVKAWIMGGKVKFRNQLFEIQSTPGEKADGVVGPWLFKDFVVRINFAQHKLTLIRPKFFNASNAGTPVPIKLVAGNPVIEGSINGVKGSFLIDTGSNAHLVLNAPFSRKHDLYSRFNASPSSVVGHGYNGHITARIARNGKLKIGPFTLNIPTMYLSTATKGGLSAKHIAGILGIPFLKHFTVTFDYADKVVYLKPNKSYDKPTLKSGDRK